MKYNKNKKVFIISIIVIVLILIIGVVYAIFATNIFKSNKDKFFQYAGQMFDADKGLIDNKIEQYNAKKQNTAYEHKGKLTAGSTNATISFAGNVDSPNDKMEELIKLNYSSSENFPIVFKKVDDVCALKFSDISKRYFGLDINKVGNIFGGSDTVADKAQNARISNILASAKDTVTLEITKILTEYYSSNNKETTKELKDLIFEKDFTASNVTITTSNEENGDYIGKITVKYNENSKCYVTGKITKNGGIDWDELVIDNPSTTSSTEYSNLLDVTKFELTSEEKEKLKSTYLGVIKDNLDNSNFTKVTTSTGEGYSLEISNEKAKEILIKLLETLKDDEIMLDKIKSIFSSMGMSIVSMNFEGAIENLKQAEVEDGKSIITIYQSNNSLDKIEFQYNDEFKFVMSKTSTADEATYEISFESQQYLASIKATYSGLQALEEVNENYEINLNIGNNYSYNIENTVSFTNVTVEDFEKNEYIDIASLDSTKANKVIETITKGIVNSNTEKAQKAGMTGINPFLTMFPVVNEIFTIQQSSMNLLEDTNNNSANTTNEQENNNQSNTSQDNNNSTQNTNTVAQDSNTTTSNTTQNTNTVSSNTTTSNTTSNSNTTTNNDNDTTESFGEKLDKMTKESFNAQYKQYEGENVKASVVKSLLLNVIANNMVEDGRKIEITGDIKLTGNEVPDTIQKDKFYKVVCSTGTDGYVNKIDIKLNP